MPAAVAQALGISTPLTAAQLPFPLFINGNEISRSGPDVMTYKLSDPGFSGNATLTFTIHDRLNAFSWIAKHQRVLWWDAAAGVPLFAGFVKDFDRRPTGPWLDFDVTCTHISECLDYAAPQLSVDNAQGGQVASDQAMIQAAIAALCAESNVGAGGFVQVLNGAMPTTLPSARTTLRAQIEQILAATGVVGAVVYVDHLGRAHTMASGDISAPYAIGDNPNYTTTIPALITESNPGGADVDTIYVYGGTAAGSGWVANPNAPPHSPERSAQLDAPEAVDGPSMTAAAYAEFNRRASSRTVTIVVSDDMTHTYSGWAKGQLITITNAPLGYSSLQLTISALDMTFLNPHGQRQYTITAGSDPVTMTARFASAHSRNAFLPISATRVAGTLGGF